MQPNLLPTVRVSIVTLRLAIFHLLFLRRVGGGRAGDLCRMQNTSIAQYALLIFTFLVARHVATETPHVFASGTPREHGYCCIQPCAGGDEVGAQFAHSA